jgi:hypothetical protein
MRMGEVKGAEGYSREREREILLRDFLQNVHHIPCTHPGWGGIHVRRLGMDTSIPLKPAPARFS